ncbi:MAG: hypothetical protein JWP97_3152, partial [Labilithrix sp.]|nr:hypothetical protein [Labilithrix sp.]
PAPEPRADGAPAPAPAAENMPRRMAVGLDALVLVPFGTLADATGLLIGPVARLGYRATPRLELTFRAGFLLGLNREQQPGYATSLTVVPVLVGARYFVQHPTYGLYGGAELGMNLLQLHLHSDQDLPSEATKANGVRARGGFAVGVGYVLGEHLPIDFRVQYTYLNVVGTESGDEPFMGLGLSVGYTLSF